jgi:hypothetical protein
MGGEHLILRLLYCKLDNAVERIAQFRRYFIQLGNTAIELCASFEVAVFVWCHGRINARSVLVCIHADRTCIRKRVVFVQIQRAAKSLDMSLRFFFLFHARINASFRRRSKSGGGSRYLIDRPYVFVHRLDLLSDAAGFLPVIIPVSVDLFDCEIIAAHESTPCSARSTRFLAMS